MSERPVFLWVLFVIPATSTFGHALAPERAVFKGQDLGILLNLIVTLVSLALWLPYRKRARWPALTYVFLGVVGVAWLYELVRIQMDQSVFNMTAATVLVALGLIAWKPAPADDLAVAIRFLAYSLLLISLASLVLGGLSLMPNGFDVSDAGSGRVVGLEHLGVPNRWGGPFGSVNYASPIGGLLIVIGLSQRNLHRWLICIGGLLILALGQGRTAIFATVAGLVVLLIWSATISRTRHAQRLRWLAFGVSVGLGGLYLGAVDPTFNGRTPIWSDFLHMWPRGPIVGIGDSGVTDYVTSRVGSGLVTHGHAHSVFIDGLVRYGLIMATLTITIFVIAVMSGVIALPTRGPGPLAVAVFVIVAGSAETIHSWKYWSVYMAALTWVVLEGAAQTKHRSVIQSAQYNDT